MYQCSIEKIGTRMILEIAMFMDSTPVLRQALWIVVGLLIGWHIPQPFWASVVYDKFIAKYVGYAVFAYKFIKAKFQNKS